MSEHRRADDGTIVEKAASYADRISLALNILYSAHQAVVFDTPEDVELQGKLLARVRDLLGFEPADAARNDGGGA